MKKAQTPGGICALDYLDCLNLEDEISFYTRQIL